MTPPSEASEPSRVLPAIEWFYPGAEALASDPEAWMERIEAVSALLDDVVLGAERD